MMNGRFGKYEIWTSVTKIVFKNKFEQITFRLLKELVEMIVPNYHTKTMTGLIVDIDVLIELIKLKVPDVHSHISKLGKFFIVYNFNYRII